MKIWCMCGGKALFSGIPQTRKAFRNCSAFFTPSAAPATKPYRPKPLSRFAGSRPTTKKRVNSMELKEVVKEKYGEAARRVITGEGLPADCCSATSCCTGSATASCDPITSNLYDEAQAGQIPDAALKASLGC